jgi:Ca-activated chloride channel family protein
MTALRNYVDNFHAGGGTAIYDALEEAYRVAGAAKAKDSMEFYSVVLMTDGENNEGRDGPTFLNDYQHWDQNRRSIKTFTVLFGEASPQDLQRIASTTGGTLFDSRNAPLSQIFKEIRGYQ